MNFPLKAQQKIDARHAENSFRRLGTPNLLVDFSSNDYLGFASAEQIARAAERHSHNSRNGATGSRLLTGNHPLYFMAESAIAKFHDVPTALIFNSGYDANIGIFSAFPQRNDVILYDELSHASIRDGIKMSHAKSYKFAHNDLEELEDAIVRNQPICDDIYIATESVFSMDGDSPNLAQLVELSEKYGCFLIVDEAHALGVFGENGVGILQDLNLHHRVFARIMTFGKGLGCHGAAILGSAQLCDYLINFARSFIYSTALSPHAVATILASYEALKHHSDSPSQLRDNISFFNFEKTRLGLKQIFVRSKSAIQSAIIPGNDNVKALSKTFADHGFDVRAILSPTVPSGQERLRICIHSFNTQKQISEVLEILANSF